MNEKELLEGVKKTLDESLPVAVKTVVQEETKEIKDDVDELKNSFKEFNKSMKIISHGGEAKLAKKEAMAATANFFKEWKKCGLDLNRMDTQIKADFLNGETDGEGGYMVPKELAKEVLMVMGKVGFARKYCRIFPMGSRIKDIATIVSGVTVYRVDQGAEGTKSKPVTGQVELIAKKMIALVPSANELIEDNMTDEEIFTLIGRLIGFSMAKEEDAQVLAGTGAPITGVLNLTSANITTMGSGLTTFAKLTPAHLMAVMDSVSDDYLDNGNAHWLMDKSVWSAVKQLAKKRVSDETTPVTNQTNEFLNIAQETVQNGVITRTLFGYPVHCVRSGFPTFTSASQAGKKFIAFGDLNNFALGDRRQLSLDIGLADKDFESDRRTLRGTQRVAGKAIREEAFAVLKTSAT